jgi:hypothetical protein
MGTRQFILDRSDFIAAVAILPKDAARQELEKVLRTAHKEYRGCLARQGTLAAEIASVSRELARDADPQLGAKLTGLIACRETWPGVMAETAQEYASALAAWARATLAAFDQVHRDAEAALDALGPEFGRLVKRQHAIRSSDDPEHETIRAGIADIFEQSRPLKVTRDLAHQGRAAVRHELSQHFGDAARDAVSERDIQIFVDRHATRKVAA